mmetsp:Transcript_27756/g.61132  ORF Transcript_27756/g.61132 Transcript_27756/m.61132 type:complete len:584 (-) Transcript_27756:241-1992(-)|eukprot:CAMPEP_0168240896 /NCGR_PEP_ID=MMETSP0140_2-20121125/22479_1 /TAXON_ID=44445 /ORGANISM="Pseudo-nitzschia australis, Strain 10249 10 AB" /LENGTH=583 /DNA_ID=CAMNT_0008175657 /DNA_START=305 /DNA_END=2056 /DNA_ORIENTATION=-
MPTQYKNNESYYQHHQVEKDELSTTSTSTTTTDMISPASMPSELKGAINADDNINNNSNSRNHHGQCSMELNLLALDDLKDVLTALKAQEASYERRRIRKQQSRNGMRTRNIKTDLPPFHDSWRPVMISWMYHVADTFRLMPIVVATGIFILDTCAWDLCNSGIKNPREVYPLMTMTALNMAVKCHETKMFPLDQLVQLLGPDGRSSKGKQYTPAQISAMERKLLHMCSWKLHKPTTHDYLLRFVEVLPMDRRDAIVCFAVLHLKQSLLWEHVAHQQQISNHPFSDCTLAYAAFLLAMEDAGLPLVNKQAACMALSHAAHLSAQTPMLFEAYNWLHQSRFLQTQLEQGKTNPKTAAVSLAPANHTLVAVPAHATAPQEQPTVYPTGDFLNDSSSTMSCDTTSSVARARAPRSMQGSNDEKIQQLSTVTHDGIFVPEGPAAVVVQEESDDSDDESCDDRSTSLMSQCSSSTHEEVIFCSYSSDGDAFEVIATDHPLEVEEDDQSITQSDTSMSILPTVMEEGDDGGEETLQNIVEEQSDDEEKAAKLVLTESLDEDGFEVAIEGKRNNDPSSLVTSPREVSAAL